MDGNDIVGSLVSDLKLLRKGRGLDGSLPAAGVSDALARACGVEGGDGVERVRSRVRGKLLQLATSLPADVRTTVLAAFALDPATSKPFYQERLRLASEKINRDERTVRRRVDFGIQRLAELLAAEVTHADDEDDRPEAALWHSQFLRAALNLALPAPEAYVHRRIVADQDDLRVVDLAVTLTAPPEGEVSTERGMSVDVVYGGTLVHRRMEAAHRLGMALRLPRPLARNEEHEFAIRLRVAEGEAMRPHFVFVAQQPCERLEVRVKFDERRRPATVWRLTKVFQDELDDPAHRGNPVTVDEACELYVTFKRPAPGFAYGVQWDETDEQRPAC